MIKLLIITISILSTVSVIAQRGDIKFKVDTIDSHFIVITKEIFDQLPKSEIITTTPWTAVGQASKFRGVTIVELLKYVNKNGSSLKFHALDDYEVTISMADIRRYNVLLADEMNGEKLNIRNFGPYFIIYPLDKYHENLNIPKYFSRFIWQVDEITLNQ